MKSRRSGSSLVIAGLLGIGFFWATDPRYGIIRSAAENVIDAANQARIGTLVGIAGSAVVLVIGLWLLTSRAPFEMGLTMRPTTHPKIRGFYRIDPTGRPVSTDALAELAPAIRYPLAEDSPHPRRGPESHMVGDLYYRGMYWDADPYYSKGWGEAARAARQQLSTSIPVSTGDGSSAMTLNGINLAETYLAEFCRRHGVARLSLFGSILTEKVRSRQRCRSAGRISA